MERVTGRVHAPERDVELLKVGHQGSAGAWLSQNEGEIDVLRLAPAADAEFERTYPSIGAPLERLTAFQMSQAVVEKCDSHVRD